MKHLTKIVLGSVLSVAMVLSAGFATVNYKKVSAYEVPTTVQTSSIVENIEVENGYASYVVDKKQVAGDSTYTGIRLAGRGDAIFNLGTIDLKEASYWKGLDHAPKTGEGAYDTNFYTAAGVDYKSFISLVYDPYADGHKNLGTEKPSYKAELERKLLEEYEEVLSASGDDRLEELADMLEIIRSLAKLEKKDLDTVITIADNKRLTRGAFGDKIFLEKVIDQD